MIQILSKENLFVTESLKTSGEEKTTIFEDHIHLLGLLPFLSLRLNTASDWKVTDAQKLVRGERWRWLLLWIKSYVGQGLKYFQYIYKKLIRTKMFHLNSFIQEPGPFGDTAPSSGQSACANSTWWRLKIIITTMIAFLGFFDWPVLFFFSSPARLSSRQRYGVDGREQFFKNLSLFDYAFLFPAILCWTLSLTTSFTFLLLILYI